MIVTSNLIQWPAGTNNVFTGCCDSEVELFLELLPGDADHEVSDIYLSSGSASTVEITEVGGIAYTTTPAINVNVTLVQTFVVTQGNQLSIKFKFCPGLGVSTFEQIQLTVQCVNHGGYDTYQFVYRGIDIATAYTSIIAESSAIYTSCSSDCDIKKDLLHLDNPSAFNLPVTTTLSTTCGFKFFLDGNPIDITDFQLPPGQSILQINNAGCVVPAPCDFDIQFDFCGNTVNIPITHEVTFCNTCGIDCRGITINSNPISMPKYTYGPDYVYDPVTTTSNWLWNPYPSTNPLVVQTSTHQEFAFSTGGSTTFDLYYSASNISASIFPPLINPGDHVTIYWQFETKFVIGTGFEVVLRTDFLAIPSIVIIPAGTLFPNTLYQGTIDVPSWIDIMGSNEAFFTINNTSTSIGDEIQIGSRLLQAQLYTKPALIPQADLDCSNLNAYNSTAVGDSKVITFKYYYHNGFADFTKVWFNPWAFDATADFASKYPGGVITQPYSGFVVDVMSSWIGAGQQQMGFVGSNSQKNYKAYINIINGNEFEIILEFFFIQDLLDWVEVNDIDNYRKLLYTSADPATNELTNTANSVYLSTKAFGYLLYIYDPNIITGYTPANPPKPVYYECYATNKVMFDVRWWNQGLYGGLPEMSNPTFSFSRNSNPVTELSTITPTVATFEVYYNGTIDNVVFWLFDLTSNVNTIDFYDNYDSSRSIIPTIASPGIIDNKLESPSVAVTNLGGGHYYVSATISKNLNPNGVYRLGAICYSSTDDLVNSFLSDRLTVKTAMDLTDICCDMSVDVHWYDYNNDYNDPCFMPTVKERIKNDMYIDAGSFQGCLENLGMPVGANWLDYMEAVILNIYIKRDTYPTPTQRTYFMYATYGALRNTSITGNWDLTNASPYLTVGESGSTLYTSWTGRVLWNDTPFTPSFTRSVQVSDMTNWMDRSFATGVNATNYANFHNITYNWADQDVYFEYLFKFDLTSFLPTAPPLFLAQINQLHPMGFEPVSPTYTEIITDIIIEAWDGTSYTPVNTSFCLSNYEHLRVTTNLDASYTDGILLATLNYYPYTEFDIKEHETAPAIQISMMSDPEMYNVDSNFVASTAVFYIDCSQLSAGDYEICSIRIKE